MIKLLTLLIITIAPSLILAQPRVATISSKQLSNGTVQFSTTVPEQCPAAGAPSPRYSYYWEFGDGTFSDALYDPSPRHTYKASGTYNVLLVATNTYDNCSTPPFTHHKVSVNSGSVTEPNWNPAFFDAKERNQSVKIKVNREAKPEKDFVAYIGYRNLSGKEYSGSMVIFFNEKKFSGRSLKIMDSRTHHGEEQVENGGYPGATAKSYGLLKPLQKKYTNHATFRFRDLKPGEVRFVFLTMQMLKEMSKEMGDVISLTAAMLPENPTIEPNKNDINIKIVKSYDPNQLIVKEYYTSYRKMKKKREMNYRVEFQNFGAGPARNILVSVGIPKQLDVSTLKIKQVRPAVLSCDSISKLEQSCFQIGNSTDSVWFTLKNIYLPGVDEKLVKNLDSTKGFVEYSLRFKSKMKKRALYSGAVIYFDDNKPVRTNRSMARFMNGVSPGLMAGYSVPLTGTNPAEKSGFKAAFVLAPYASTVAYFQFELHSIFSEKTQEVVGPTSLTPSSPSVPLPANFHITSGNMKRNINTTKRYLQLVPLHLRKDLTDWMGIGIGIMGQIQVLEKKVTTEKYELKGKDDNRAGFTDTIITTAVTTRGFARSKVLPNANLEPFFDVQFGKVKTGLVLGVRYFRSWDDKQRSRMLIYGGFKL